MSENEVAFPPPEEGMHGKGMKRRGFLKAAGLAFLGAAGASELLAACAPSPEDLALDEKLQNEGVTLTNADVDAVPIRAKSVPGVNFTPSELGDLEHTWDQYGLEAGPDVPSAAPLDDNFYQTTEGGGVGFIPGVSPIVPPIFYPKPSETEKSPPVRSYLVSRSYDQATPVAVSAALSKTVPGAMVWLSTPPPGQDKWATDGKKSLWLTVGIKEPHHNVDLVVSLKNPSPKASAKNSA